MEDKSVQNTDQNTPTQPQEQVNLEPVKKSNIKWLILIGIILVILLGVTGGGYFFWKNYKIMPKSEVFKASPSPTPTATADPSQSESIKNDKEGGELIKLNGISFLTPSDWIMTYIMDAKDPEKDVVYFARNESESAAISTCLNQTECYEYPLRVSVTKTIIRGQTMESWLQGQGLPVDGENIIVDGKRALKFSSEGIGIIETIYTGTGDYLFTINVNAITDAEEMIGVFNDQILESFEFSD